MTKRALLLFGLALAACGDAEDAGNDLRNANQLTAERVAAEGDYCCYENGAVSADSPEVCATSLAHCIWSQTYSDVDQSGWGTMCGYLACE